MGDEKGLLFRARDHLAAGGLVLSVPADEDQKASAARKARLVAFVNDGVPGGAESDEPPLEVTERRQGLVDLAHLQVVGLLRLL
jgi:hypothetical protein